MLCLINRKAFDLKIFLLKYAEQFMDAELWEKFTASLSKDGKNYIHFEDDIPSIRDFKAFINRLTAIERLAKQHSWKAVTLFKLPSAVSDFHQSHTILNSTSGIVNHYFAYAKELAITTAIPLVIAKLNELLQLCNSANFDKGEKFLIQNMTMLQQYQSNYRLRIDKPLKDSEEKTEKGEDVFRNTLKKYENFLKKIYKHDYSKKFPSLELDISGNKDKNWDFLFDAVQTGEDTTKNLKILWDAFSAMIKINDDYDILVNTNWVWKLKQLGALIYGVKSAYDLFQKFDARAILAEQASPFAECIKLLLKRLNNYLENLTCIVDEIEGDLCLKEGTLLKYIYKLLKRYNRIINALKIPLDFVNQKRLYFKARMEMREKYLRNLDLKLYDINRFLIYKNHALADIPLEVLYALQNFIFRYEDEISINRDHLAKYKNYLHAAITTNKTIYTFLKMPLESLANQCRLTLHYEMMKSLSTMRVYLRKQKVFLNKRLQRAKNYYLANPFDYFKFSDLKIVLHNKLILDALNHRADELNTDKITLFLRATEKKAALTLREEKTKFSVEFDKAKIPELKEKPNLILEEKSIPVDKDKVAHRESKIKSPEIEEMVSNQMISLVREHGIFTSASEQYARTTAINPILEWMRKEDVLSSKSILLLDEIEKVSHIPETKNVKLA